MSLDAPQLPATRILSADGWRLFATRCIRLFAYGFLPVVLVLYLKAIGLNDERVGLLLYRSFVTRKPPEEAAR